MRTSQGLRIAKAVVSTAEDRDLMVMLLKLKPADVLFGRKLSARAGEHIAIFDLRVFGVTRQEWIAGLREITSRKAFVVEIGREDGSFGVVCGDHTGAELIESTIRKEHLDKVMPREKLKRLAGEKRAFRIAKQMPREQALKIWMNRRLTVKEAITLMHGWATATAYRDLGPRDMKRGPVSARNKPQKGVKK